MSDSTRPVILAAVSDLHCGSTTGLHPLSDTVLDDGGTFAPSPLQKWLWDGWIAYWHHVATLADQHDADVHLLFNGDMVDGAHHGTTQIVSALPGVQLDILHRCVEPVLLALKPRLKSAAVIRGTEAHTGAASGTEEAFGRWLLGQGVTVPTEPGTGNLSHGHFYGMYGGMLVDATHHGRMGGRPWTKFGAVGTLAAEITLEYARDGLRPPALALRAHYHQFADTGANFPVRVVQMPAWQAGTSFVKRVKAESLTDIGGVVAVIAGGRLSLDTVMRRPERASAWVAPA